METINCSVNIAHLAFHATMFREIWGKLGMVCVAGQPNMAKTKDVLSALHMASDLQYFYAMKVKNVQSGVMAPCVHVVSVLKPSTIALLSGTLTAILHMCHI